jgi:arabinogalactan oligomer/maltooligosaccharide transport system permease protein
VPLSWIALLGWFATAATPPRLTLWHSYRDQERAAFERAVQAAEERGGYRIDLEATPSNAFSRKLAAAIPHGSGPDLFVFAHEPIGEWSQAHRIAPLREVATGEFLPGTLEPLRYDGKLYGLPLAFKCLVLFYRTDLVSTPPASTDELVRAALAHNRPAAGAYGIAYESGSIYHHGAWLHGFGGWMLGPGGEPGLASEGFIGSLRFARHLSRDLDLLPPEPSGSVVKMLFNEGRAAFAINGPWFVGEIQKGVPFAVAPLPILSATGRPAAPFLTIEALMISGRARDPALAERVAADLAGQESAIVRALEGGQPVASRGAWSDPRIARHPILAAFRAQLAHAVPMSNRPEMSTLWEPAAMALRSVLRGDARAEAAARAAQRRVKDLLRPLPAAADPTPYAIVLGALALAAAVALAWWGRRRWPEIRRSGRAYRLLAPAAVTLAALTLFPLLFGVALAFFEHRAGTYTFVGLTNFSDILASREYGLGEPWNFYTTFAVTTLWTALNVALHVAIGVALALWLSRPWMKMRGLFRVLLILPWAVPNYITALLWKGMFHAQFGAVNEILGFFGAEPVSWFASFWPAFSANVVTNVWLGFPFMMVVTLGALQSIPQELHEAAAVDGATGWQRFWRVTVPLLKPALVPAIVLGTVWTFNMFNVVFLVSGGEPDGATDILVSEAYRWAFARGERYGYAAAYALLIFFILLGYARVSRRFTRRASEVMG